jgi:hypothetical protein
MGISWVTTKVKDLDAVKYEKLPNEISYMSKAYKKHEANMQGNTVIYKEII